jgi:hypothetical protein
MMSIADLSMGSMPLMTNDFRLTIQLAVEGKAVRAPLKEMADELPPVRRLMLQKLIRLLRLLSLYHETNKMTAVNLAVVMGPNICRPRVMTLSSEALSQTQCVTNAVVGLIDEYEFILPREPPSSDKYLTQAKRESGIFTFDPTSPNLERVPSSGKVSLASKEAEDAVSTKLALSLSELSPDASALKTPQSARGAANRNRNRGASAAAKNRGFSNALEWLVTSVQDDVLEEVIADKDDSPEPASDEISSSSSATKLKRSKKSKSPSNGSKQGDDETAETGSEASITSPPKRERSKKLKSSSSANSTETSSTSASEPASPREPRGLTDSSSSSTKKKKKSTSTSLSRSNLELPSPADSSEDPPKSPRRRIAPPSREASENSGEY